MATAPNSNINIPYSEFLNATTGRPNQEWLMWLMNPQFITVTLGSALPVTSGGTGLTTIPTNGQLLIGNGTGYTLNQLTPGAGIGITNGVGLITVANTGVLSWSGGSTGLTPATATTGAVTLAGTLGAGYGGTNATATPTAGAVAYGTGSAYAFTSAGTVGQVLTSAGAGMPTWTTAGTGTVTSVTGTAPVVSSGGTTPAISMAAATTSVDGYLTSTDWTTFNAKQKAITSGTAAPSGGSNGDIYLQYV